MTLFDPNYDYNAIDLTRIHVLRKIARETWYGKSSKFFAVLAVVQKLKLCKSEG
jgi:hypothetical protein